MTIYERGEITKPVIATSEYKLAQDLLANLTKLPHKDQGFARSLCDWVLKDGRAWSYKQADWAYKLNEQAKHLQANSVAAQPKPKQFPNIAKLFSNALASGLAWPKITYDLPTYECPLVLSYVPRYDCIQVKCNNQLKGTLKMPGGIEDMRWPIKAGFFTEELTRIEADPVKAAVVSGKETNHCCFCNKHLTDERSVVHGYGPVCATNYDLPWDDGMVKKGSTKLEYRLKGIDTDISF